MSLKQAAILVVILVALGFGMTKALGNSWVEFKVELTDSNGEPISPAIVSIKHLGSEVWEQSITVSPMGRADLSGRMPKGKYRLTATTGGANLNVYTLETREIEITRAYTFEWQLPNVIQERKIIIAETGSYMAPRMIHERVGAKMIR